MGNKITNNNHQQSKNDTPSKDPINLIHNKFTTTTATTTCINNTSTTNNNTKLPQHTWFERQEFLNDNKRCILLQQLEQTVHCQQQLQLLTRNFHTKSNDNNNNNTNNCNYNTTTTNNNNNNNINNCNNNNNNNHVLPESRSLHQSFMDKTSFSPLQYVKRKFSLKKQERENDRVPQQVVASSSSPPSSSSSPPSSSSSSSLPQPSFRDSEITRTKFAISQTKTSYDACNSDNNNNYYCNSNNNNYFNNNNNNNNNNTNLDIIDGYLGSSSRRLTDVPASNYQDHPSLPALSGCQHELTTTFNHPPGNKEPSTCGNADTSVDECQGQTKKGEVIERNDVLENHWTVENYPITTSSPGWKVKKKIRTNPWIAHSSVATPPSSPDISHLNTPTGGNKAMKKQFLNKKYSFAGNHETAHGDKKYLKPNQEMMDGMKRHDDDLNSCSEGYYSSSFGSLSGFSVESPTTSPFKMKKFIPESNDSGFFSMINSCNSYLGLEVGPLHDSESDDVEEATKETIIDPFIDDEIMPLPCSRDLIAINQLLRMNQTQKQFSDASHTSKSVTKRLDEYENDDDDDDVEDIFDSKRSSTRDQQSLKRQTKLQRKISFEMENQIFELKHNLYDEVFDDEEDNQLLIDQPILFQREQHQQIQAPNFTSSDHDHDISLDSFVEDDTKIGDTVDNRSLEDIQSSLETSYKELWMQERNAREKINRLREMEDLKKEELKAMREISIENKKLFLIQTLQRLKVCLDQQKAWLQRTYDSILEKKWPVLHQVKG